MLAQGRYTQSYPQVFAQILGKTRRLTVMPFKVGFDHTFPGFDQNVSEMAQEKCRFHDDFLEHVEFHDAETISADNERFSEMRIAKPDQSGFLLFIHSCLDSKKSRFCRGLSR